METGTCIRKVGRAPKLSNLQKPRPLRQVVTSTLKDIAEENIQNNANDVNIQNLLNEELMDRLAVVVLQDTVSAVTGNVQNNNVLEETSISTKKRAPRGNKLTRPPPMKKKSGSKSEDLETELLDFVERLMKNSFNLETTLRFRDFLSTYGVEMEQNNKGLMEKCFECLTEYLSRGPIDTLVEINLKDVIFLRNHNWEVFPTTDRITQEMGDNSGWSEIITSSSISEDENHVHRKVSTQQSVDSGYGEIEEVLWDCEEDVSKDLEKVFTNRQYSVKINEQVVPSNLTEQEEDWETHANINIATDKAEMSQGFSRIKDENANLQNLDDEWERHVYISGSTNNNENEWDRCVQFSSKKDMGGCPRFHRSKSEEKDICAKKSLGFLKNQEESWEDDITILDNFTPLNGFSKPTSNIFTSKFSCQPSSEEEEWVLDPPEIVPPRNGFQRSVSVEEGLKKYFCDGRNAKKPICDTIFVKKQSSFPSPVNKGFNTGFKRSHSKEDNATKPSFKMDPSKPLTNKVIRAPIGPGTSTQELHEIEGTLPNGMYTAQFRRTMFRRYKEATTDYIPDESDTDRAYTRMELLCLSSSPMSKRIPGEWSYLQKIFPEVCCTEVTEYFDKDIFLKPREFPDFTRRPAGFKMS